MALLVNVNPGLSVIDPRQQKCWDLFVDPGSPSFGNARSSAIAAGYDDASAMNITIRAWFKERKRQFMLRIDLLSDAEKALSKTLKYKTDEQIELAGKKKTLVNTKLLSVQVDAAKHVTKTLGKDKGWAERVEQTGKDGAPLPQPIMLNINAIQRSNRNPADNGDEVKDTRGTGRDLGEQDSIDSLVADQSGAER
jgi:hypothetical protein